MAWSRSLVEVLRVATDLTACQIGVAYTFHLAKNVMDSLLDYLPNSKAHVFVHSNLTCGHLSLEQKQWRWGTMVGLTYAGCWGSQSSGMFPCGPRMLGSNSAPGSMLAGDGCMIGGIRGVILLYCCCCCWCGITCVHVDIATVNRLKNNTCEMV